MSKPIHQQRWYAMPPDNAVHGKAALCNWQIATETGELVIHEGDRDAVEHIVALHNASLPLANPARELYEELRDFHQWARGEFAMYMVSEQGKRVDNLLKKARGES